MAFAADMYYLEIRKKLWQDTAYSLVDGNGTKTAADH